MRWESRVGYCSHLTLLGCSGLACSPPMCRSVRYHDLPVSNYEPLPKAKHLGFCRGPSRFYDARFGGNEYCRGQVDDTQCERTDVDFPSIRLSCGIVGMNAGDLENIRLISRSSVQITPQSHWYSLYHFIVYISLSRWSPVQHFCVCCSQFLLLPALIGTQQISCRTSSSYHRSSESIFTAC